MNPYTVPQQPQPLQPRLGYADLNRDVRSRIRQHTAARFVVEQRETIRMAGIVDRELIRTPWIRRFEFELKPRTVSSNPQFSMRITDVLDPTYRRSREFAELSTRLSPTQLQMFDNNIREDEASKQVTFPSIQRIFVLPRNQELGQFALVEACGEPGVCDRHYRFLTTPSGSVGVVQTPSWCRVFRSTWEEVHEKLQSLFHMELEENMDSLPQDIRR
jgi:hypothetical protein